MKAIFVSYNQALTDRIMLLLNKHSIRGFTKWQLTEGRGSVHGEPHFGTHTWPAMNSSILAVVDESKVQPFLASLRELDSQTEMQGLRAFVWNVEDQL